MLYPINEIFYSIQGEGYWSGAAAVFVRLAGCNLKCPWCDTKHEEINFQVAVGSVRDAVTNAFNQNISDENSMPFTKMVVITGGEPTIQDIRPLVKVLTAEGYFVTIESNGTNWPLLKECKLKYDTWTTLSPKSHHFMNWVSDDISDGMLLNLGMADEVKVVYDCTDETDRMIEKIEEILRAIESFYSDDLNFDRELDLPELFIQPCSEDFQPAIDFVAKHPWWRLSVQTQKVIGVK